MERLLSVIVPCYNSEKTIKRCLDSIPNSEKVEIIIIDDCSTDNTKEIIEKYKRTSDKNIILHENSENSGPGISRNNGIRISTGKYITFLDSDDMFLDGYYEEIKKIMDNNYDVIVYNAKRLFNKCESELFMFFSNKIKPGKVDAKKALVFIKGCTCGKVYKSAMIKKNSIKFGDLRRNEDSIFTKTAVSCSKNVFFIDKALYLYIDNSTSLSNNDVLLDPKNIEIGFESVYNKLNKELFEEEINSLYYFQMLYCLTISNLRSGKSKKEIRRIYKKCKKKYNKNDKYRKEYNFIYRFTCFLFDINAFGLYLLLRNLIVYKNKLKRGTL